MIGPVDISWTAVFSALAGFLSALSLMILQLIINAIKDVRQMIRDLEAKVEDHYVKLERRVGQVETTYHRRKGDHNGLRTEG